MIFSMHKKLSIIFSVLVSLLFNLLISHAITMQEMAIEIITFRYNYVILPIYFAVNWVLAIIFSLQSTVIQTILISTFTLVYSLTYLLLKIKGVCIYLKNKFILLLRHSIIKLKSTLKSTTNFIKIILKTMVRCLTALNTLTDSIAKGVLNARNSIMSILNFLRINLNTLITVHVVNTYFRVIQFLNTHSLQTLIVTLIISSFFVIAAVLYPVISRKLNISNSLNFLSLSDITLKSRINRTNIYIIALTIAVPTILLSNLLYTSLIKPTVQYTANYVIDAPALTQKPNEKLKYGLSVLGFKYNSSVRILNLKITYNYITDLLYFALLFNLFQLIKLLKYKLRLFDCHILLLSFIHFMVLLTKIIT